MEVSENSVFFLDPPPFTEVVADVRKQWESMLPEKVVNYFETVFFSYFTS